MKINGQILTSVKSFNQESDGSIKLLFDTAKGLALDFLIEVWATYGGQDIRVLQKWVAANDPSTGA
ncbi:hypothetical protein COC69_30920 [Bacillus cereus]|uniref:Uncharacterized protein n=1 Tax=Bacillus cereus TaxID=1396 RepID=A0A9X7CHC2_BACCE|nr:hypothetical protein [Bacillus cereus]PGS64007.1 hypothetical protein COC69_30920 [Bacillus cereus]